MRVHAASRLAGAPPARAPSPRSPATCPPAPSPSPRGRAWRAVVDAASSAPAAAAGLDRVRDALPQAAGLELEDLIAPLSGEAASSVAAGEDAPVITLAARTADTARTREAMARLQGPVADLLGAGGPFSPSAAPRFTLDATAGPAAVVRRLPRRARGLHGAVGSRSAPPREGPITGSRALEAVAPEQGRRRSRR